MQSSGASVPSSTAEKAGQDTECHPASDRSPPEAGVATVTAIGGRLGLEYANTAKLCSLFESLHRQFEKSSLPFQRRSSTQKSAVPTRAMQEMNRNFSLQYLVLQQNIQQENPELTALSNVMKARHDAAKNALNNVR